MAHRNEKQRNSMVEHMRRIAGYEPRSNPLNNPLQRPPPVNTALPRPTTLGKTPPPPKKPIKVKKKNKFQESDK